MEQGFFSTQGNRILGALTMVMIILALASWAILNLSQAEQEIAPATISVEGTGEVTAVPDIGTFSFSVEADGETAAIAQEASATKINDIIAYLKEAGVEEKDIKTAHYNVYPKYRYEDRVCAFGSFCPPGEQIQDGFTVSQSVTVKVRKTEQAGELVAGVGERGATNISGLSFTIDDVEALKVEARDKAIADARQKAEKLAGSLGVKIVRVMSYSESNFGYPMPYAKGGAFAEDAAVSAEVPEMPVGEESTNVTVNVTFEIR